MSNFKWNDTVDFEYFDSYIGKKAQMVATPKQILEEPSIMPQDKLALMQFVLVELMEKVENEEMLKEFDKMTEGMSL